MLPLTVATALALGATAALSEPASAASGNLTYDCDYGTLATNVPTTVSIDTDAPASSTVLTPLDITTTATLTMPHSVVSALAALPGFTSVELTAADESEGMSESYIAPGGTTTPVIAHPAFKIGSANANGDRPFSGSSPSPYHVDGPKVPGQYSIVAGAITYEMDVAATTPTKETLSCTPTGSAATIDTLRVVAPTTTAITVPTTTWLYGTTPPGATATVTRSGTVGSSWPALTGAVQFYSDGQTVGSPVQLGTNGQASLAHLPATLGRGSHTITASYVPDAASYYTTSTSDPSAVTVNVGTTTQIVVTPAAPELGEHASATATVTAGDGSTAAGQVTFAVDGTNLAPVALSAGKATVSLPTDQVGHHTVTASFAGTAPYQDSVSAAASLDVGVAATTTSLTVAPTSASYGEPVTASATVGSAEGTPTGTVTFTVAGKSVDAPAVDGVATATLPALTAGTYSVTATFVPMSADTFRGSSSDAVTLSVQAAETNTVLQLGSTRSVYGEAGTAMARVTSASGTPAGTVRFTVDGRTAAATVVNGVARTTLPSLPPGTYRVVAGFVPAQPGAFGSSTSKPVVYTVGRDASWLKQTVRKMRHGKRLRCAVVVHAGHGTPVTGTVQVTLVKHHRVVKTRTSTVVHGRATARFAAPKRGRWSVVATYLGSPTLAGAASTTHGRTRH